MIRARSKELLKYLRLGKVKRNEVVQISHDDIQLGHGVAHILNTWLHFAAKLRMISMLNVP